MRLQIAFLMALLIMFPATSSAIQDENNDLIEFAEGLLELLVEEDFDSFAAHFDEQMSEALSVEQLAQTWQGLQIQVGKFKGKIEEQTLTQQGYDIVIFLCEFENANINIQLVFNEEREISGLFFRPAE